MGVLVRCREHAPNGRENTYVAFAHPVGYPDTAVVCPSEHHRPENAPPGLAYMHERDFEKYQDGKRVFETPTAATNIRLTDEYSLLDDPR